MKNIFNPEIIERATRIDYKDDCATLYIDGNKVEYKTRFALFFCETKVEGFVYLNGTLIKGVKSEEDIESFRLFLREVCKVNAGRNHEEQKRNRQKAEHLFQ